MFQKFFTNTVTNKFIKNILSNIPLPSIKTVRDGDLILEGCQYIYQNMIIKCTQTGPVFGLESERLVTIEDLLVDDDLVLNTRVVPGKYQVIDYYVFGEDYKTITSRFISHFDFYDSETHYQLGHYLRCLRDLKGIDLMPFYNCFNYKVVQGFYLDNTAKNGYVQKSSDKYDLYAVPIKFNTKYTIAFTCKFIAKIKSVFYGDVGLTRANYQSVDTSLTDLLDEMPKTVSGSMFNQPFVYEIKTEDKYLLSFENDLSLIIQLPKGTKTSVVVLEGDYVNLTGEKIISVDQLKYMSHADLNKLLIHKPSLLVFDDGEIYAFSDKLIECLTLNEINSVDEITEDTQRVQSYIREQLVKSNPKVVDDYDNHIEDGQWNNYLRYIIYKLYLGNNNKVQFDDFDVDGFVDKRVEDYITKGLNV